MAGAGEIHERAVNDIYAAGLMIATLLTDPRLDDGLAKRLGDVNEQLDAAIMEIHLLAFADVDALRCEASPQQLHAVHDVPTSGLSLVPQAGRQRSFCRFDVDEVFAYAMHGPDLYRAADDELWAHESDGYLLAAHSGTPFARRVGRVFYEIESNEPLYYERA